MMLIKQAVKNMYTDLLIEYAGRLSSSSEFPMTECMYENLRNIESHAFRGSCLSPLTPAEEIERLNWFKAVGTSAISKAIDNGSTNTMIWAEKFDIAGRVVDWLLKYYRFNIKLVPFSDRCIEFRISWS